MLQKFFSFEKNEMLGHLAKTTR